MGDESPARAIDQVRRIKEMCDFLELPAIKTAVEQSVPVSMPADPGSLGFDIPFWVGFATVGLWAALDAFAERAGLQSKCSTCKRKCIVAAYTTKFRGAERRTFAELEDLRHLYAHNYGGVADEKYFKWRRQRRHVLKGGVRVELSCGAIFDGWRLCREDDSARPDLNLQYALNLNDLRMYSHTVRTVLERFQ
jgi:hypothetical protein